MKKIKTLLLGILIATAISVHAQTSESYDYAVIYYGAYAKPFVSVSVNGNYTERNLEKDEVQGKFWYYDLNPALKELKALQERGYEVYTLTGAPSTSGGGYTFLLRRKAR